MRKKSRLKRMGEEGIRKDIYEINNLIRKKEKKKEKIPGVDTPSECEAE